MKQFDLFGEHEEIIADKPKPSIEPAKPTSHSVEAHMVRPFYVVRESKTATWILHEDYRIVHHA